jgi:hypothetical protein
MSIRLQPSKFGSVGGFPEGQNFTADAALTCLRGAVLRYLPAGDDVAEHPGTTTVVDILGVALCDVTAGVSDDPAGTVPVALATDVVFCGQMIESAAVKTDLSDVSIGDDYGIIKHTDNEWYIDFGDTTDVVARITKIDDDLNLVWFRFLASAIQQI